MRIVIQKVKEASVTINSVIISKIKTGLMVLLGIEESDTIEDVLWLANKMCNLRIFNDENNVMNLSILDMNGEILIVSQFTLHALTKKGNRPSYIKAARPETAIPLYNDFIRVTEKIINKKVSTGEFGAMMDVALINDGPVTIIIDSKNRE